MHRRSLIMSVMALLLWATASQAGGLGIPMDGFLLQFQNMIIGLGLLVGLIGIFGWILSTLETPFGMLLSGSVRYFVAAGILGGATIILGALGLVSGGLLP